MKPRLSSRENHSLRAEGPQRFLRNQDLFKGSMCSSRSELASPLTIFAGRVTEISDIYYSRVRAVNGQSLHQKKPFPDSLRHASSSAWANPSHSLFLGFEIFSAFQ